MFLKKKNTRRSALRVVLSDSDFVNLPNLTQNFFVKTVVKNLLKKLTHIPGRAYMAVLENDGSTVALHSKRSLIGPSSSSAATPGAVASSAHGKRRSIGRSVRSTSGFEGRCRLEVLGRGFVRRQNLYRNFWSGNTNIL